MQRFHTTLQKAAARFDVEMMHDVIGRFGKDTSEKDAVLGIDATGFNSRHAIHHTTQLGAILGTVSSKYLYARTWAHR